MAKYFGKDGIKKGKIAREIYYYAFQNNLIRERPLKPLSPNTKKNIITKGKFGSVVKFTDYCLLDSVLKFFPLIKGAKMKRSAIIKENKNNFLAMHKKYYKRSSLITFGEFSIPGSQDTFLRRDSCTDTVLGENNQYNGLLVAFQCTDLTVETVGKFSTYFLSTYPQYEEGDIVHFFGVLCENCRFKNSVIDPISIEGNCIKKFIHRQLTIKTNSNDKLIDLGIGIAKEEDMMLMDTFTVVAFPLCNKYKVFRAAIEFHPSPGCLYFWVEKKNGGIHEHGGVKEAPNYPYQGIKQELESKAGKVAILDSWKKEEYPIVTEFESEPVFVSNNINDFFE